MRSLPLGLAVAAVLLPALALADDPIKEAIAKDRAQIKGTWRITALEVNGNKSKKEDLKNLRVINESDGRWSLQSDGEEVSRGTSILNPTAKPKTIDFTVTNGGGEGDTHFGIYKLNKNRRKLCFAPAGEERPSEFTSKPGTQHILVIFERVKPE